ncbi:baseplate multidomain protein megatron [Leisingera methylohalidivorans]|uniref:Gene transfer agent protein n=1 Tax=Leisingera methylohalidivorans DSM 14336 TaxID=999552 RepID=V9VVE0_9RHOB|nr:glycoside hydrolase/phage tail family protein [Leisingera methylohalidivorans]AHD00847.1 gene transfer agent protein [Leisingera methylohalidivorans DSM 14336]
MATILLSAAGAAIGGTIGGSVAGLSSAVIGRAVGATLGRMIDERLLGSGADPVETGKVDRFRLTQASEGAPVAQVYGRMRLGGQVIWASQFLETSSVSGGGGKGRPSQPQVTSYSYSVSLAIALCEGEVAHVSRVWADGEEVAPKDLNMTVYTGGMDQLPDPVMEAVEGAGRVPAYRGTAYVVMENLDLARFGNRVPQFSFDVLRPEQPASSTHAQDLGRLVQGVALMPGTGEYALAADPVFYGGGPGSSKPANQHTPSGLSDLKTSLNALEAELPSCGAASLIVSWFGDDLRCGSCRLKPKVEHKTAEGDMPWTVSGLDRNTADEVLKQDGEPLYGGTPADAAVVQSIREMQARGLRVMFYPFILMDQAEGNALPDPWTGGASQPHLPWRGRITLSAAPGRPGSADGTAAADAEVADFFGSVTAADFAVGGGSVAYTGPDEWSLSRFILHNAALCAAAGGVEAFCISSEMRALTQIRGAGGFPAVAALRALAAEVRILLGAETKIGYAADWSEYWGYQSPEGDRYFHLDPLWADANIDFIGIDNYMPLSDWREGEDHLDAQSGVPAVYDRDYLRSNVEGGEGFDWYYHSAEARDAQIRTPITDGAHEEPWIWRYKDIRSWWAHAHHERIGGVRQAVPTGWVPQSKPVWFTELGCAAIDKGSNQPNKFLDPKSSESKLPRHSKGLRDDLMQIAYLRAILGYWGEAANNPLSEEYEGRMLDMANAYVWAWDARPFPAFPSRVEIWNDGENYLRGHWLNGRAGQRTLASVVEEVCHRAGLYDIDVSQLYGVVHGLVTPDVAEARTVLQPLMLRHGFDAVERGGLLMFRMRKGSGAERLALEHLAESDELGGTTELSRAGAAELAGRVRLRFTEWGGDHAVGSVEAVLPDEATHSVSQNELPLALTRAEARQVVSRWLAESRISRDIARFSLPPSMLHLGAGDVVALPLEGGEQLYRIDRVEQAEAQMVEAVRIEPGVYDLAAVAEELPGGKAFAAPGPVLPLFMDLPLMRGNEVPHAPHLAVTAEAWPGSVAVYGSGEDENYALEQVVAARQVVGVTQTPLLAAAAGRWDLGADLQVKLISGALESRTAEAVLNGANAAAIGDGTPGNWELFQFREAELIAPQTYLLRGRLRGQQGTDALMPDAWPAGSYAVLLDGSPVQMELAPEQRRRLRHYRIGPARRALEDPSYVHLQESFDGIGLRPYAPVHLRLDGALGADISAAWIRRTRIEGDSWELEDVPLGEEVESYRIRVMRGGTVLREAAAATPEWSYPAAAQAEDGVLAGDILEVAQRSARFGAGPAARAVLG